MLLRYVVAICQFGHKKKNSTERKFAKGVPQSRLGVGSLKKAKFYKINGVAHIYCFQFFDSSDKPPFRYSYCGNIIPFGYKSMYFDEISDKNIICAACAASLVEEKIE